MKTISLHISQVPSDVTPEEITFRDEVGFNEILTTTFSGDGTRFIRAEIYAEPTGPDAEILLENFQPDCRPLKLSEAVTLLQSTKRYGDWWNPNTERFLGFWTKK
jgi:hypothetical protein